MDIQLKSQEELISELHKLRKDLNSLKELYDKDITERFILEDTLRESNSKLAMAMVGGNMAWWEMDIPTGNVTFDNRKVEMLGYSPELFKHYSDFTALVHPNDYERIMNAMRGHLEGSLAKYEAEYRILTKSGEYIWFYDYGSVVKKDSKGRPLICTGFVFNITERKNTEKKLLYIVKAVESTSDSIGISDALGHHFYQNKAFSELFGYKTADELESMGGGPALIKDPKFANELKDNFLIGKSRSGEIEMLTKSGKVFPAFERTNEIKDTDGNIMGHIGIITDITERKQNEENLMKSQNMLQAVLDHFPGVVFWKDRESKYLGCNQSFANGAGLNSPAEIIGKTDIDLPWGEIEGENYRSDDFNVMQSNKSKLHIIETQHQTNGRVVWLDTSKIPLHDIQGQVIGVIGVSNDISILKTAEQELILKNKELVFQIKEKEKKALELIVAKEKAEESDRLKTAFLNNISHEIRTPFNGILGFLSLLQENDVNETDRDKYIAIINQSADRLMNTINEIVDISQIQAGNMTLTKSVINVKILIEELVDQYKTFTVNERLAFSIINKLPNSQCDIFTDNSKLRTILSNLVGNAFKFTKKGSIELTISKKRDWLEFSIKDTGIGIPSNKLEIIFERFMQANVSNTRQNEGLGLGLTLAKIYVKMLGGKIWAESEEGRGSSFYFTIKHDAQEE